MVKDCEDVACVHYYLILRKANASRAIYQTHFRIMILRKLHGITLICTLIIAAAFTACDTTEPNIDQTGQGFIQMKTGSGGSSARIQSSNTQQGTISINDGTNEIEIQEVKFFLEEFELDGTNGTADFELEDLNDFIVNLPLDGTPLTITQAEIPVGLYDEFEMEIEKPDSDIEVTDLDFRDETGSYSVVVKGLYNGEEFTFRSSEDFEIDVDLNPPLEITETSQSTLVIEIFVPVWFMGADGMIMNPKELGNAEKINENIENSFEAFEDAFED